MNPPNTLNIPMEALHKLSQGPRTCIERLIQYFESPLEKRPDLSSQSLNKLAAVLVLLYEEAGQLRVLLTTRSKALRTHAGQTALPGGKVDETDKDLIGTAFREAQEEVNLPLDCPDIHMLGLLEPFLSLHKLVVTPVVAFLTSPVVLESLKAAEGEVAHIFSHPLEAILDPSIAQSESLSPSDSEDWIYDAKYYHTTDSVVPMLGNTSYRMHRFRSSASPIKGLTSDILIKTAEIAFGKPATYERYAPGQLKDFSIISAALSNVETKEHTVSSMMFCNILMQCPSGV